MKKRKYEKEKNCTVCGITFITKAPNNVNCSNRCTQKKSWKKNVAGTEKERLRCLDKYRRLNQGNNYRFTYIKYRASCRGIEFLLTKEEFDSLYKSNCAYCNRKYNVMSLDRVDSKLGYIKENVVSSCIQCNQAKMGYTLESFLEMCKLIVKNRL